MYASGSQLAQVQATTSETTAYTARLRTEVTRIVVCNTTGSAATYSIYHDDDGTTYDESTALFYGVSLNANSTDIIDFGGAGGGVMVKPSGTIGVKSGTGSAITLTFYGITEMAR